VEKLEFQVDSITKNVSVVIQRLEDFCKKLDINVDIIENLSIATDEAVTNIILHAYEGRDNGRIEIAFNHEENALSIQLIDYGKSFKPGVIEKKPKFILDQWEVGGFGLILMNEFMDELRFSHDEQNKKNCLVM